MSSEKLNEVLKYAIENELAAAEFYRDMQSRVKIPASTASGSYSTSYRVNYE
ncbi:MAG: hypothetical protein UT64_C0039G0014 [Candidatus Falkowbacteria bacterium GW2011_GWF2_39_8]|uniref:Rubrerythrin diiron-binding domain-containing protein n=1 Tax=Candidatus Falkowbacteria bacterium GW2011_GWF2_39_8 TaxID=1618642 RepID=A0A0G0SBY3_9BACT|nr:MAG: hypothetical protein UT64_C0039G0014 [Candidatus Falkowbacteria bacterium GW2011_GWF2_39_8]